MGVNLSPAVQVKEVDLSSSIPSLATSITGVVGEFQWGPINYRRLITSPRELETVFGKPTGERYQDWYNAYNVLQYNNLLYVVRAGDTSSTTSSANSGLYVSSTTVVGEKFSVRLNDDENFEAFTASVSDSSSGTLMKFVARYPGAYGNKLSVAVSSPASLSSIVVSNNIGGTISMDKIIDISSTTMPLLGTGPFFAVAEFLDNDDKTPILTNSYVVSAHDGDKDENGNSLYFQDFISQNSEYLYAVALTSSTFTTYSFGNMTSGGDKNSNAFLTGGTYGSIGLTQIQNAYNLFSDPEEFDVNILTDCHNEGIMGTDTNISGIQKYITETIIGGRLDCFCVGTVPKSTVVNVSDPIGSMTTYALSSLSIATPYQSFFGLYGNWKYQYDKYSGKYRWLPISGDMAGIFARTDNTSETWMSPAGFNRGGVKNVEKFAIKPNKAQRDVLYKSKVNPVLSFVGDGPISFGQKTFQTKPSAFDRIDVRRLFIYMEKSISTAAKYFIFEKNTPFTRRLLKGLIDPFLGDIKGREGIEDFLVVCDESNNTRTVIDRNELICSIYVRPTKSAETISLVFTNVGGNVTFEELANR